ncbi:MAG TPA: DUF6364 family protein [Kiritimatiellia bacterium]|nr:DUF6364 family protein [Kiritimatiellia bacterium]HRT04230.1 DUF6364 family protein [Kiritimatiellia bacterium]
MNVKLTLRMDDALIRRAKQAAGQRGKSVSQMVAEFFGTLGGRAKPDPEVPPVTASLLGVLREKPVDEGAYKRHLREKHL